MDRRLVLVINSGSSSVKYKLFEFPSQSVLAKGVIERIGEEGSGIADHKEGILAVLSEIEDERNEIFAVGHRVVHGGERFREPVLINDNVIDEIRNLSNLAPLHNPANLEGILACKSLLPSVKQVAVFDTAFHSSIPDYAYLYAIPYELYQKMGIRKYGFHGTSHQYVTQKAAEILGKDLSEVNLITCHLGNGCSITAVSSGKSVDTSMGLTPLEGLIMGTRCGDLDPAVVLFLQEKMGLSCNQVNKLLNKESGLKGISGVGNDFRVLMKERDCGNPLARLAIEMFKYRLLKYVGAYAIILGRVDAVVFTGGIGEHVGEVRDFIASAMRQVLREVPPVLVVPTDEELMIAIQTVGLAEKP